MRKINFLKTVLSVAFATLAIGAFGQIPADYEAYDPADPAPNDSIYITVGNTMGYYVTPDPVYHPTYTADGVLTDDFTWDWTVDTHPGTAPTITPGTLDLSNYATILYPVVGRYIITVAETAPDAFGGCAGNEQTLNVTVIPTPTGTMTINPGATWEELTANRVYQICAAQVAQTVTVSFHEVVPLTLAGYSFQITEQKELIDGTGTVIAAASSQAETVIQNFELDNKLKTGNIGIGTAFSEVSDNTFNLTFATDALAILQTDASLNARTRYTYRVRRADETTGTTVTASNDFISAISHKSDYLEGAGNEDYFAFTNNTVSFIVNPAPVTGPIFHIPNDFNY